MMPTAMSRSAKLMANKRAFTSIVATAKIPALLIQRDGHATCRKADTCSSKDIIMEQHFWMRTYGHNGVALSRC
jgi:hypothetical protein